MTGSFEQTLDDKSRILIPASLRKKITPETHGDKYYLVLTPERRLWIYPDKYFEFIFKKDVRAEAFPQKDMLALDRLTLGNAVEIEPDKAGRIVVPEESRKRVTLGKTVKLVGIRDHIEIWDPVEWMNDNNKLMDRGEDLIERAKMARRGEDIVLRTQTVTGHTDHL